MDSNSYPFAEVEARWQRLWEERAEGAVAARGRATRQGDGAHGRSGEQYLPPLAAPGGQPEGDDVLPPASLPDALPGSEPAAPPAASAGGEPLPPAAPPPPPPQHLIYNLPEPLDWAVSPVSAERGAVPAPRAEESAELTFARLRILSDTLARYERHRGRFPEAGLSADGFSPAVVQACVAGGKPPGAAIADGLEVLSRTERSLGIHGGGRLVTSDRRLYRFMQWVFLQLLARKLAYRSERTCAVCGRCGTRFRRSLVGPCPRCGGNLEERKLSEWRLDLTAHADRLITDLDRGDWTQAARADQQAIFGRKRGIEVIFPVSKPFEIEYEELTVFTTRVETIFGATFILLDPYHPILDRVLDTAYEDEVCRYRERLRKGAEPGISAVRTGGFALNPANLRRIPLLVSGLASDPWGGGALMAVPAHDAALFELAKRMKLPIREVIHHETAKLDFQAKLEEAWLGDGVLTNSGPFTSLPAKTGRERIVSLLARKGVARRATRYRLRSLPLSGLSPWGPPVPLIRCRRCGILPVAESDLPVEIPPLSREALARGEGALAALKDFTRVRCPNCGEGAERETETLAPWLGSAVTLLEAAVPALVRRVEGLRDLSPESAREDRRAVESGEAGARPAAEAHLLPPHSPRGDDGAAARSHAPASRAGGDPGRDVLPPRSPRGDERDPSPRFLRPDAGEGSGGGGAGERNVLPEDIDIFEVRPGAAPVEEAPGEDDLDTALAVPPEAPAEAKLAPSPEGRDAPGMREEPPGLSTLLPGSPTILPGSPTILPLADAGAGTPGTEERPEGRRGRERRSRARGDGGGKAAARAGGHGDAKPVEEEGARAGKPARRGGEEPETIVPELAEDDEPDGDEGPFRLSTLRPFASAADGTLLPAGLAIGPGSRGTKELLGLRCLIKFLHGLGHLNFDEPFLRYRSPGKVAMLADGPARRPPPDGKTAAELREEPRGAAGLIARFGADAVRLQVLSGGPLEKPLALRARDVLRMRRLLDRIWRQMALRMERGKFVSRRMLVEKHGLIDKVTRRIAAFKLHTALAAIMSFVRFLEDPETAPEDMDREAMKVFLILLSPFAPHLAAELWSRMGAADDIESAPWPVASDELIHPPEREFAIVVEGRIQDRMQQPANLEPEKLESRALGREKVREIVGNRRVKKVIVVPGKLVSIVLEPEE